MVFPCGHHAVTMDRSEDCSLNRGTQEASTRTSCPSARSITCHLLIRYHVSLERGAYGITFHHLIGIFSFSRSVTEGRQSHAGTQAPTYDRRRTRGTAHLWSASPEGSSVAPPTERAVAPPKERAPGAGFVVTRSPSDGSLTELPDLVDGRDSAFRSIWPRFLRPDLPAVCPYRPALIL